MNDWPFFNCPKCKALYHVVKVAPGWRTILSGQVYQRLFARQNSFLILCDCQFYLVNQRRIVGISFRAVEAPQIVPPTIHLVVAPFANSGSL